MKITSFMAASALAFAAALTGGMAQADDKITIRLSNLWPENHMYYQHGAKVFAEAVTEATGGKVVFENFHASQLGKDQLSLLSSGLADFAIVGAPYSPDKLPLSGVVDLPGVATSTCDAVKRLWPMAQDGGLLDQHEYDNLGIRVLFVGAPPGLKVMTTKKEVTKLEDLNGLKLRALAGPQSATARGLGAIPVQMQAGEVYESLSRGTVDGAIYIWVGVPPFSLQELLHHTVEGITLGSAAVLYGIRQETWDKLPADVQQAMIAAGEEAQQVLCDYQDTEENKIRDSYVAAGTLKITEIPEEEADRWRAQITSVASDWAKQLDDSGRPGSAILEAYTRTPE
ncbi:TRAP transporter substrate-binding protein DctP [Ruixingdingia sedimenti]|uniref:TRAP transporter substrate-binding protein DctP n=1 Tax=Ruixingdingia sedimenti TaxID=3073604 RepID=A0ABU1F5K1_9RHOB|nr:TRAP transporter substrate-binding protein DctP [Xinfangfangia sp. LG-4]MDR5652143.1 TRAP transporter substrate-binding protein DctP [Xinfangfangia sp. LG-4]